MHVVISVLLATVISGCSVGELRRVDGNHIEKLGVGIVLDAASTEIDSDESLADRTAVGVAAGGVVGGVATAITEPGFTSQIVHRYIIRMDGDSYITKVSRSVVEVGDCVEISLKEGQDFPILRTLATKSCASD